MTEKSLVFIEDNRAVTDSLTVADVFNKRHSDVIRDIEVQISKLNEAGELDFAKRNFALSNYQSGTRDYKKYNLSEEAFTIVAMSYVTPEAMKMKVRFIEEFKRMRDELLNRKQSLQPKSQAELIAMLAQYNVEQERRLIEVEERLIVTEKKQENINEILSLNPVEWRKKVNQLINKIAQVRGGFEAYQDVRNESYTRLEERAKCQLSIRLTNKQKNMALEGSPKSKIGKVNKMDVIADDARLTEIYLAIVKEMAIQHNIEMGEAS